MSADTGRVRVPALPLKKGPEEPMCDIPIFVATRPEDVPPTCRRFVSVDGSVPGAAVCWDHHRTGEPINLDAMPDRVDPAQFDGVGTTMADADAVVSVVALLLGGRARIPAADRAILESASHWCDHLRPHPAHGAEVNRLGRGLLGHVATRLRAGAPGAASERFAQLARDLAGRIREGLLLPYDDRFGEQVRRAEALDRTGRIERRGPVALVDLRGTSPVDPLALYTRFDCPVAVFAEDRTDGGLRYTVGVHPTAPGAPSDLGPVLAALAAREYACGPPARAPHAAPDAENWGGRRTVFGSPWNYGSRLSPDEVVAIVREALRA